ncbi:MAG: tRNA dihydrouridine synthase DusB [Alphaproteobacteria bacterium]|nr:tRNA dihydrouridine synthase DusB [Alphaproteobacteria bacterium]
MITNNQIFAAPMAGISDYPFRRMIREFAPGVPVVTEMISCHSLVEQHKNCLRNFDKYGVEGNVGTQIFGAVPDLMADAARILEDAGATWIDINMGCPVPKVATRANAGAFLMRDHGLAGRIIAAVVRAVKIPVSVKTRLGWDNENMDWVDLVHVAADAGVKFLTLHGRTRAQGYTGVALHPKIKDMPIPIIANGDIVDAAGVQNAIDNGYAGAMIGRAMMGRPWIFGEILGTGRKPKNIGELVMRHLDLVLEYYGARAGVPMFRKHIAWYSAGMPNSSDFRVKINQITDETELKQEILQFWGCVAKR